MRNLLYLLLLTPLVLVGCSNGTATVYDDPYGFDTYDLDDDGYLDDDEFYTGFGATPYYDDYDLDADGYLDDDEFYETGFDYDYGLYDDDDDGFLDDDEFYDGVYDTWDGDDDGLLDEDEFNVGFGASFGL